MADHERPHVVLVAAPRGDNPWLLPEQAAVFDLSLRNESPSDSVTVPAIGGNAWTPIIRAYDAADQLIAEGTFADFEERSGASMGEPVEEPPATVTLAPAAEDKTFVDLWDYTNPLGKGDYGFAAEHLLDREGALSVKSATLPFKVVDATVTAAAHGYVSCDREATFLAWLATPENGEAPCLLIRLSAFSNHGNPQRAGTLHGEVAVGSRLSVGQLPADGMTTWTGWVARVQGGELHLLRHNMGAPMARVGPIALPAGDVQPIPRFPDRGHAVFLGIGTGDSGQAVLTGVVVGKSPPRPPLAPGEKPRRRPAPALADPQNAPKPWSLDVQARPELAACAFARQGPIALLFASQSDEGASLFRLDVDEDGGFVQPERLIYETPHKVLAICADIRRREPLGFYALVADRVEHDHVSLLEIPLVGDMPEPQEPAPVAGWPELVEIIEKEGEPDEKLRRPLPADRVALEIGLDGARWLALTDAEGNLYGGS